MRKIIVIVFCIVCAFSYAKGKKETVATPAAVTATSSSSSSTTSSQNNTQTTVSGLLAIPATGSSCDIRANNNAYNAGYNMISQNGGLIDFANKTVNDVYNQDFPNNRSQTPQKPAGLAFFGVDPNTKTHVEFYQYSGGSQYQLYKNDGANNQGVVSFSASNPSGRYTYVPLSPLPLNIGR